MISNNLSMVQYNSAESARLSAAVDGFISLGGQIQQAQAFGYVPKPVTYGSFAPPGKGIERAPPIPKAPALPAGTAFWKRNAAITAKAEMVEKLRQLSATMTQSEAASTVGTSLATACKEAIKHGFEYIPAENPGHKRPAARQSDSAEDAKNVERITAMRDLGVTRKQAAKHMDISSTLFTRLLSDYAIDYPLAVNRHK